jgi:alkylhydroperoxidase family enzyme
MTVASYLAGEWIMARIPYASPQSPHQEKVAAEIAARRGGSLLNLDRILLHSPPYAVGWNSFLGAVRGQLRLPARLRELAICAVAVLNRAEYEYQHHAPEFIAAGGSWLRWQCWARPVSIPAGLTKPSGPCWI